MSKAGGGKRRGKASTGSLVTQPVDLSRDALCLQLVISSIHHEQLQGCPVPLLIQQQHQQLQVEQQQDQQLGGQGQQQQALVQAPSDQTAPNDATDLQPIPLQMESWSQLPAVLSWFSSSVLQLQPSAKLNFPPCLPKELRADVHNHVSKKLSKVCQSVSEGLGDERYVAVVAKGAVKPAARRMTGEQQDHAMALWLLWKQHSKERQRQQQQQQQQQQLQQQQADAVTLQEHTQMTQPANDPATELDSLPLDGVTSSSSSWEQDGSCDGQRVYSRDEIAQMLVQGKLTAELSELWSGPKGDEQRAVRLLCLAAAAGDAQEAQELLAAHPGFASSGVADLSAGGALPLQLAAAGGCVDVVHLLLAAGAPLEAKDGKGLTALQVAQRSEQCDVEAVLVQAGAVNKQKDSWGTLDMPGGFL